MTPHVDEDGKPLKLSHMILEGSLTASHRCVHPLWPATQCLGIVQEKKIKKGKEPIYPQSLVEMCSWLCSLTS